MATIAEVYQLWSSVKLGDLVDESIKDNESVIIDAQILQMRKGINADGDKIGEYQDPEYAKSKKAIGGIAPLGDVDLRVSGDFEDNIKIEISKDFIKPRSTDWKNGQLIEWYGPEIYGLVKETQSDINQNYILGSLQTKLRDVVKLS